ncbi:MAG: hypothetical protein CFE46_12540 [Burkholderiales bacterium PBB6]|nr:MAG: hypothetical protein CFE46_12540 [Burkholderiales bacterium PBB6]
MIQLQGIDHIYLSVSELPRSEAFYDLLLGEVLGHRKNRFALNGEPHVQYFNAHFGVVLRPARVQQVHQPYAPGLHHLCLRVDQASEVRAVAQALQQRGVACTPATRMPDYAPDYVATYLDDPDGIRLEVTNLRGERRERHDTWLADGPDSPVAVVQRQLDAYNARDLPAWLATYAPDASQYAFPATLLAQGHAQISARMAPRFADPLLHARLHSRTVRGDLVIDDEAVARPFDDGPGWVALQAIYQVQGGLIRNAVFNFGARLPAEQGDSLTA